MSPYYFIAIWMLSTLVVVALVVWWLRPRKVTEGQRVLEEFDAAFACGQVNNGAGLGKLVTQVAFEASLGFKEEYGEVTDNKANRIMAHAFVRDYMRKNKPDMRHVDVLKHVPMAIELCFTPTQVSLRAARVAKDASVRERKARNSTPR